VIQKLYNPILQIPQIWVWGEFKDMEINILRSEKNELEFNIDNLTLAEILRVYLNKDSDVSFAAWTREHPTKPLKMLVKTKGKSAKKAVDDAVNTITKELDKIESDFKKSVK
jgi:DNA-directed RNA polymerase subunit L